MITPPGRGASDAEILAYARAVREEQQAIPSSPTFEGPWPARFTEPIGLDEDGRLNLVKDGRKVEPLLTEAQLDRVQGVLLGLACGDALGVPYEFARPPVGEPQMLGGGLGDYAPGEGSDDSQMAVIIASSLGERVDLRAEAGLDRVVLRFIGWALDGPADIGMQTQAVLSAAADRLGLVPGSDAVADGAAAACRRSATAWHVRTGRSAGNGALMRTAPVALPYLFDPDSGAEAARAVAELTHADWRAGATCVLAGEAIRRAVTDGVWDPLAGLDLLAPDQRDEAAAWVDHALAGTPAEFADTGYTVRTLQGAFAAVERGRALPTADERLAATIGEAVRGGGDTDTVAAVAGALAGALDGASAVPAAWRDLVHVRVSDAFGDDARFSAFGLMAAATAAAPRPQ